MQSVGILGQGRHGVHPATDNTDLTGLLSGFICHEKHGYHGFAVRLEPTGAKSRRLASVVRVIPWLNVIRGLSGPVSRALRGELSGGMTRFSATDNTRFTRPRTTRISLVLLSGSICHGKKRISRVRSPARAGPTEAPAENPFFKP